MSEEATQPVAPAPSVIYERREFDESAKGFHFYTPQWQDLNAFVTKYGQDVALGLINSSLAFAVRVKAKAKLPALEDKNAKKAAWEALKAQGRTCLFSEADAAAHIPGVRESSPQNLIKQAEKARKEGNKELAKSLLQKALSMVEDMTEDLG